MKKIILSAIAVLMISISGYADEKTEKSQDSAFQKAGDVINGKYEVKTVPFKKITIFQTIADNISVLGQK